MAMRRHTDEDPPPPPAGIDAGGACRHHKRMHAPLYAPPGRLGGERERVQGGRPGKRGKEGQCQKQRGMQEQPYTPVGDETGGPRMDTKEGLLTTRFRPSTDNRQAGKRGATKQIHPTHKGKVQIEGAHPDTKPTSTFGWKRS